MKIVVFTKYPNQEGRRGDGYDQTTHHRGKKSNLTSSLTILFVAAYEQPFRQTKFKLVYLFEQKYCAVWRLRPYKISPLKEDSAGFLGGKKLITTKWWTSAKFCEDFSPLFQ